MMQVCITLRDTSAHADCLGVQVDRSLYGKVWNYAASALTSHI